MSNKLLYKCRRCNKDFSHEISLIKGKFVGDYMMEIVRYAERTGRFSWGAYGIHACDEEGFFGLADLIAVQEDQTAPVGLAI